MAITDTDIPESDVLEGTPHPRLQENLLGHRAAEEAFLDAYRGGRMHHAWILGGPEGIGKATLAYHMARFLMTHPDPQHPDVQKARSLQTNPDHPAVRQIMRMAHPDLVVLKRGWNKDRKTFYSDIRIDDVRKVISFFGSTAGADGWRICIVDTADDLNTAAANGLLKVLEEPPPRALFLILSAAPRRLLPTIRSRCRTLMLDPLPPSDVETILRSLPDLVSDMEDEEFQRLAEESEGSIRHAASLIAEEGLRVRDKLAALLNQAPDLNLQEAHAFSEILAGKSSAAGFQLFSNLIQDWLHERASAGARAGDPRLARWTELWDKTNRAVREAEIYNLDKRPLVLSILQDLAAAARG